MEKNKKIVVSAINITSGGPLSILKQVQRSLKAHKNVEIIYLLGTKKIIKLLKNEKAFYFPLSKKNWLFRLFYEYIYFKNLSKKIRPDIWFSLHDISPFVIAKKKFVYCHNPSIFLKLKLINFFDYKLLLFKLFYKFLYRFNIKSNNRVIVQQSWIKKYFKKNICPNTKIEIIRPDENKKKISKEFANSMQKNIAKKNIINVLFPTTPRTFKNIEFLIDVSKDNEIRKKFIFNITISGNENLYARYLKLRALRLKNIKLIGYKKNINQYYKKADIVITTSLLETWSLPLSEAVFFKKFIMAPNLPYAKENLNSYPLAIFFNVCDEKDFKEKIVNLANGNFCNSNRLNKYNYLDWQSFWRKVLR
jgi:UDP-N-acetylglucosamine:LPS N-acetylglucosamine transferase